MVIVTQAPYIWAQIQYSDSVCSDLTKNAFYKRGGGGGGVGVQIEMTCLIWVPYMHFLKVAWWTVNFKPKTQNEIHTQLTQPSCPVKAVSFCKHCSRYLLPWTRQRERTAIFVSTLCWKICSYFIICTKEFPDRFNIRPYFNTKKKTLFVGSWAITK